VKLNALLRNQDMEGTAPPSKPRKETKVILKAERKRKRGANHLVAGAASSMPPPVQEGLSFLEKQPVRSEAVYLVKHTALTKFCEKKPLKRTSLKQLDQAATMPLDYLYFEGIDRSKAFTTLAAIRCFLSEVCKVSLSLPRASKARRGWKRLCPDKCSLPMPWPVACLICNLLVKRRRQSMVLFFATVFARYGRPGGVLRLLFGKMIKPSRMSKRWAFLLQPPGGSVASKTLAFDESWILDNPKFAFLGKLVSDLQGNQAMDAPVFFFNVKLFNAAFRENKALERLWPLMESQKRGRLTAATPLNRYENGGRAAEIFNRLSASQQRNANLCADLISKIPSPGCAELPQ
jgi:hypothetical protein